ncbi:MAG: hypothetical protein K2G13_03905 [Muribaculaceae bacterium]|nr:hypothetical protein [Muribaculaceae bacterium]
MSLFRKALLEQWEELPPVFLTSSEKKKGRESILEFIEQTNAIWHQDGAAAVDEVEKVTDNSESAKQIES